MTEPEETPKSKHSKAFLQHPDDPGLLFPFSATTLPLHHLQDTHF